ncbi:MAG: AMP-dependent synthetase/ligase, partial [Bacteroidota bacterium]
MQTIPSVFRDSAEKYSDNVMMWEHDGKSYQPASYLEMFDQTRRFAVGLKNLGLKKNEKVALLAEGRNQWVTAEFGVISCGAVSVPLSVKLSESQELLFRINHSESSVVIVSGSQAHKIRKIQSQLTFLKSIIIMDREQAEQGEVPMDDIIESGRKELNKNPNAFDEITNDLDPDDTVNICYTSGTTADPKGIMLSHHNYLTNTRQATSIFNVPDYYTSLLILPWDHSFAHTVGVYTLMTAGASMASVQRGKTPMETLRNIPKNIKEIKPHFLLSVPSLAKNFRKNIEKGIRDKGGIRAIKIFNSALNVAYKYNQEGYNRGKGLRLWLKIPYAIYERVLFRKIRENFGDRLKFFVGGGALLDIELQRFFYAIGIPMYQGYGLSEAAPIISANTPDKHKLGSSGKIVPELQVKICDSDGRELPVGEKGEIVVKGDNVMQGYWKNQQGTKETIVDGWLYTGDMGYLDDEGYLFVTGRFKSLLIAEDGEKFSPEGIEEALVEQSRYIEQVMLYNNQSPYTVALLVPNREALVRWLSNKHEIKPDDSRAVDLAIEKLQKELEPFYKGGDKENLFPQRWMPGAVAILNEGFNEENKLLNSTMKLVRSKVIEKYKGRLQGLFSPKSKSIYHPANREAMAE